MLVIEVPALGVKAGSVIKHGTKVKPVQEVTISEFGNVVIKFLKGNMTVPRAATVKLVVA